MFADLALSLQPKERIWAPAFWNMVSLVCTRVSYRDAAETLNMLLYREGSDTLKLRTLSDRMNRLGTEISTELTSITKETLAVNGFDCEMGIPLETVCLPDHMTGGKDIPVHDADFATAIEEKIMEINSAREEQIPSGVDRFSIEADPATCVYISIDDIGVKRQKDKRGDKFTRETRFVENTVAHIQQGENTYVLTAVGMLSLFKSVLAFLLVNDLLRYELVFFTDGARNIKSHVGEIFAFHPSRTILDWYHLKKRCQELLSLSIKGKEKRNIVLEKLLRYLWVGDVEEAKKHLKSLPADYIKNPKCLDDTVAYIKRKQENITCYALRAKLDLRNSSNPVEKANDLLVAERQKHNGMAWTPDGSGALAAITMIYQNNQATMWFTDKSISLDITKGKLCA